MEWNAHASLGCSRVADKANSEVSVSKSIGRPGSHMCSTGADVSAAFSPSRVCCSAGPYVNLARGCRGP